MVILWQIILQSISVKHSYTVGKFTYIKKLWFKVIIRILIKKDSKIIYRSLCLTHLKFSNLELFKKSLVLVKWIYKERKKLISFN